MFSEFDEERDEATKAMLHAEVSALNVEIARVAKLLNEHGMATFALFVSASTPHQFLEVMQEGGIKLAESFLNAVAAVETAEAMAKRGDRLQ